MGIVIGAENLFGKVIPVNPMPVPEYNVLTAFQSMVPGKNYSIALNTIVRSAKLVLNTVTLNMPEYGTLIQTAINIHKITDADKDKDLYSRLTKCLITTELQMVKTQQYGKLNHKFIVNLYWIKETIFILGTSYVANCKQRG